MSPRERRSKIYKYLKTIDDWITVDELSKDFNVSVRTVYNDLDVISENITDSGWFIDKKRGVGIRLNSFLIDNDDSEYKIDLDDRKVKILEWLLVKNEIVTFEALSNLLFVSVSSIKKDIEIIKELLSKYTNVKLYSTNNGTKIVGYESEIRDALVWFNQYIIENQTLFKQSNLNHLKIFFKHFYNETLVDVAYDILFDFVQNNNNLLSDYYILNTLNVYIVQLHRLILQCHLENNKGQLLDFNFPEEIHTIDEFSTGSKELLSRASARLSFIFSENEVNYLTKYLILNRLENIPMEATNTELIEDLIRHLSDTLVVNLNQDMQLKKELMQHVPPMLYRLKLNIKSENPFVNQIKNEFGATFHTIKLAIDVFETRLDLDFNDEEIALLTIYFQSAIERKKQTPKILVVCQHGLAMSELLVNRLENIIPFKVNIKSSSIGELAYFNLDDYDLVISTVNSLKGENILKVSTFLNKKDINRIINRLSSDSKRTLKIQNVNETLLEYLNPEYILINSEFKDKDALIESITNQLLNDHYIQKDYIENLINREKLGNTDLPTGVAIPHGNSEFVNKSMIVIIKNKNKIKWNEFFIDKIFIPLISPKDILHVKKIIKEIYNLIEDKDILTDFSKYLVDIKERLYNG
ncbi:BglG family transcription antiterminator [Marinilactibacillus psychrotolerans]|uniref:BglG family transcription antiterminator n=1 Tax=Marinilactibacillus psychrotolerans TaxID=191770 RepID=UPI00186828CC|nr:BglG family transcription antiterminator [Marinilactibacillus psychrotolerans]